MGTAVAICIFAWAWVGRGAVNAMGGQVYKLSLGLECIAANYNLPSPVTHPRRLTSTFADYSRIDTVKRRQLLTC